MQFSYVKGFVGFNFIFGNGDGFVLYTIFDKLVKVLQGDYKSAQLIVLVVCTCFLNSSITENRE